MPTFFVRSYRLPRFCRTLRNTSSFVKRQRKQCEVVLVEESGAGHNPKNPALAANERRRRAEQWKPTAAPLFDAPSGNAAGAAADNGGSGEASSNSAMAHYPNQLQPLPAPERQLHRTFRA